MFFLHYAEKRTHRNQSTTCKSHRHHMVWGLWFAYAKKANILFMKDVGLGGLQLLKKQTLRHPIMCENCWLRLFNYRNIIETKIIQGFVFKNLMVAIKTWISVRNSYKKNFFFDVSQGFKRLTYYVNKPDGALSCVIV